MLLYEGEANINQHCACHHWCVALLFYSMIKTFADLDNELLFFGQKPHILFNHIWRGATRKLLVLDGVESIQDLHIPSGNRLEKLRECRAGK